MIPPKFKHICCVANREGLLLEGHRDTCVLTSAALHYVLGQLGIMARPLRIRAAVHHPSDRKKHGVVLGSDGDGFRLPKAKNDCWHGHLAVVADGSFLLDATIDQVIETEDWIEINEPFVGEVSSRFLMGEESLHVKHGNAEICYSAARKQVGFLSAPDWRYRSHWKPLALRILSKINAA
jgi:hypothetical protein